MKVNQLIDIYTTRTLRGSHFPSRIEEITSTHLVIGMPFNKGIPVHVDIGAAIYGKIITESSPFLFSSHLIEKKMAPLPVWLITKPTELIKIQQREFVRIDANIQASVALIDQEEDIPAAKLSVNDISGGGLRLVSTQHYPVGTNVFLSFELPTQEMVETIGQIVRVWQPQPERPVYWLGVKFVGMPERDRNKIIKYVFQKQLERHRRGF